jgi:hypothetical protein
MVDDQRIEDLLTIGVAADTFVIHDLIAEVRELRASVEIAGQELAALKLDRDDQHAGYMQINALYQAELKKVADCHDVLKAQKQERDAALARVGELEKALKAVEWKGLDVYEIGDYCCPGCGRSEKQGHAPDCIVGQALRPGGET